LVRGANLRQLWDLPVQQRAMAEPQLVRKTNLKWRKGLQNEIWYTIVKVQIFIGATETEFKRKDPSFGICSNWMQAQVQKRNWPVEHADLWKRIHCFESVCRVAGCWRFNQVDW
jgi:hypothetical protein